MITYSLTQKTTWSPFRGRYLQLLGLSDTSVEHIFFVSNILNNVTWPHQPLRICIRNLKSCEAKCNDFLHHQHIKMPLQPICIMSVIQLTWVYKMQHPSTKLKSNNETTHTHTHTHTHMHTYTHTHILTYHTKQTPNPANTDYTSIHLTACRAHTRYTVISRTVINT